MTTSQPLTPSPYRVHKGSGQAYINVTGKRLYLGRDGRPETTERYNQLVAEWMANGGQLLDDVDDLRVKELIARFWVHAEQYYVKPDGTPTSQIWVFRMALRPLVELHGNTKIADFGPRQFRAVRQNMIDRGWCRKTVNQQVGNIKRVFRWGVEHELVPGNVYYTLQAVSGLKRGRSQAVEAEPVKPVPQAQIDAVKPHVSRQVWAIIQLQILTSARAGELVGLRPCDLDMSGIRPTKHAVQPWTGMAAVAESVRCLLLHGLPAVG